jgi:cell division protein FtsW
MKVAQRAGMQLMLITLALVGLGMVMVYSSSQVLAQTRFGDPGYFLKRQIIFASVGVLFMLFLSLVPPDWWAKWARFLLIGTLILLGVVLVLGWMRWIRVMGFSFQPSEFAKLALIVYLADVLARKEKEMEDFQTGLVPRLLFIGLVMGLIAVQPNLSTAMAVGMTSMILLWIGGARTVHLLGMGLAVVPFILVSLLINPYQMKRVADFLKGNYQTKQSLIALGSGGLTGLGVGESVQKQLYLPEPHTDFIFAIIGEELGLVLTLVVLALFVGFAVNGLRIARRASTYHGFLLATGITAMITVYALINIGVATKMLPTTGLPLPFVSYGGSALIGNLCGVGILLGIARAEVQEEVPWQSPYDHEKSLAHG